MDSIDLLLHALRKLDGADLENKSLEALQQLEGQIRHLNVIVNEERFRRRVQRAPFHSKEA